jgi:arginine decarboxylase
MNTVSHLPRKVFFTRGVGVHKEKLNSFELALRDARIEKYNLVRVSSILPPECQIISRAKGLSYLKPGEIVYTVLSTNSSNEKGRIISAAIGCAIPQDRRLYGYISEVHEYGMTEKEAGEHAEDLAAEMLASTLGIPFDVDASYDEKREIFSIDGRIVKTQHIAQSAKCSSNDKWTTVIAAAVFVME